ncbi:MAG: hypothetical protein K1X57_10130 [Gemmataceae bacterium]|nr:hypothetical protein [Gemmataceae bacterium]
MRRHTVKHNRARRLGMYRLEDRITPAVSAVFDSTSGLLRVTSDGADSITIGSNELHQLTVNGAAFVGSTGQPLPASRVTMLDVIGGPGSNVIDLSGVVWPAFGALSKIREAPSKGTLYQTSDSFSNSVSGNVHIDGGAGNDTVTGSAFRDVIDCFAGDDSLAGGDGDDVFRVSQTDIQHLTINGDGGFNQLLHSLTMSGGATGELNIEHNPDTGDDAYKVNGIACCTGKHIAKAQLFGRDGNLSGITVTGTGGSAAVFSVTELADVVTVSVTVPSSTLKSTPPRASWDLATAKKCRIAGSSGGDSFFVQPGSTPIEVVGGGGADACVVNAQGLGSAVTTDGIQVSGRAPVTITGVSAAAVSTTDRFYDDVARNMLSSLGVSITTTSTPAADGSLRASFSLNNAGTLDVRNAQLSWSFGASRPGGRTPTPGMLRDIHKSSPVLAGAVGSSNVLIYYDQDKDGTPKEVERALGVQPPSVVTFSSAAALPGGSIISAAVSLVCPTAGTWSIDEDCDVVLRCDVGAQSFEVSLGKYFENGDIPTQDQFSTTVNSATGAPPTGGPSSVVAVDALGTRVLSLSSATGIDSRVTQLFQAPHLYLNGSMIDVRPNGTGSGNGAAGAAEMSLDGRWVAFESSATNLVTGFLDTNGAVDVFLRDTSTARTFVLPHVLEKSGNAASFDPHISGDGKVVIFRSSATDLIPGLVDNNNAPDLFQYMVDTGELTCLSTVPGQSVTCDAGVIACDLDGDGAGDFTVAYLTSASNTGSSVPAGMTLVMKKHIGNVKFEPFTAWSGTLSTAGLRVSPDGDSVFVWTDCDVSSLVGVPDTNGANDIIRCDPATGAVSPVSLNAAHTAMADGASPAPGDRVALCFDGTCVAFSSTASNLVAGIPAPSSDGVYRSAIRFGYVYWSSERLDRVAGSSSYGSNNRACSISADGRTVVWTSDTDYSSVGAPSSSSVQVWGDNDCDDNDKSLRRVSATSSNPLTTSNGAAANPIVCSSGACVVFSSAATDILPNDTNGAVDAVVSRLHNTWSIRLAAGSPPAVTVSYDAASDEVRLLDSSTGTTLSSRPMSSVAAISLHGRDGVDDAVTLDFSSGLGQLSNQIYLFGGSGLDTCTVVGRPTSGKDDDCDGKSDDFSNITLALHGNFFQTAADAAVRSNFADVVVSGFEACRGGGGVGKVSLQDFHRTSTSSTVTRVGNDVSVDLGGCVFVIPDMLAPGTLPGSRELNLDLGLGNDACAISLNGLPPGVPYRVRVSGGSGSDTITATGPTTVHHSGFLLDGGDGPDTLTAGDGDDTIVCGNGADVCNGGAGNDVYKLFSITAEVQPAGITDPSGTDTLDVSGAEISTFVDLDNAALQFIAPDRSLLLSASIESFVGGPFDDFVAATGTTTPRTITGAGNVTSGGGGSGGAGGDILFVDAKGHAATVLGGRVLVSGSAPISFSGMEQVYVVNNSPTLQVAAVQVNDGSVQRSRVTSLTVAFSGLVDFVGPPVASFKLSSLAGDVPLNVVVSAPDGFTVATITFTGPALDFGSLRDGRYTLTVFAATAFNAATGPLDGNGDGTPGDNYVLVGTPANGLFRLFGDSDGSGQVTSTDFLAFRLAFLSSNVGFDFDGSGQVGSSDFLQFRLRFLQSV